MGISSRSEYAETYWYKTISGYWIKIWTKCGKQYITGIYVWKHSFWFFITKRLFTYINLIKVGEIR